MGVEIETGADLSTPLPRRNKQVIGKRQQKRSGSAVIKRIIKQLGRKTFKILSFWPRCF